MELRRRFFSPAVVGLAALSLSATAVAQTSSSSSSSNSAKHIKKPAASTGSILDAGAVSNGVYRNKTLALSCKIPEGWVLRTDEMNDREEEEEQEGKSDSAPAPTAASSAGAKVLLAAFSRPPEARAEDVNSSIVIAAESVANYPGLKDAVQYFGPLTEVAHAQGLTMDEDPYEIAVGTKTLVRGDFHKDIGSRVMHQSTLTMLSHSHAISITIIAGTEDEVEELIDGLTFSMIGK
jgi:hypothetical protein